MEPLYKGQVGGGSFVPYIQWNLSTRDKLQWYGSFVPYTVEPLSKGQVGDGFFVPYTVEPLSKEQVGVGPLSLIQWSFSTRDKLGVGPLSQVEPLYKGQVGGGSFVPWLILERLTSQR